MFTNLEQFMGQMNAFVEKEIPRLHKIIMAKMARIAFTTIVILTPRRTGYTQAGWNVAVGSAYDFLPPKGAESYPTADPGRVTIALANLRFGDEIVIFSNVLWINKLNEGSSELAPAHFVEAALDTALAMIGAAN
jgi:hypothetical protein